MAALNFQVDTELLKPLIEQVAAQVLHEFAEAQATLPDKLAFTEQEAARLLGLRDHQLRDERLRGRIQASQIVGRRIRYQRSDLVDYLTGRRVKNHG